MTTNTTEVNRTMCDVFSSYELTELAPSDPVITMNVLPKKQREAISFIIRCWRKGWLPVFVEIGDEVGGKSTNTVAFHINALRKKGWLRKRDGRHGVALGAKSLEWVELGNAKEIRK